MNGKSLFVLYTFSSLFNKFTLSILFSYRYAGFSQVNKQIEIDWQATHSQHVLLSKIRKCMANGAQMDCKIDSKFAEIKKIAYKIVHAAGLTAGCNVV